MMTNDTLVLAIASYSGCGAVVYALTRFFRRRGSSSMPALLAATAFSLGLLVLVPGVLHTLAVIDLKIRHRNPYDLRFVFLVTTGLILIHVGAAQLFLSRSILRGSRWATGASAATTLLLLVFVALLSPLNSDASSLLVVFGGYLALLMWHLVTSRRDGLEVQ